MNWLDRLPTKQMMRSRVVRDLADRLEQKGGKTNHSAQGATLRYLISLLEEKKVLYTLHAVPGYGYQVEVIPPEDRLIMP